MAWKPAKLLIASVAVACCGPLGLAARSVVAVAVSDGPTTSVASAAKDATPPADRPADTTQPQPQPSRPQTSPAPAAGNRVPGWPFNQPGKATLSPTLPNEDEWRAVAKFMAETSPARWQVFEQVLSKPGRARQAKRFLFARYTELRDLQKLNPIAYDARVQQIKFEDDVFRIESAIRAATSPGERDALQTQLHDRVTEAVKQDLADRQQRLKLLQERLDKEKATLEVDKGRIDETADHRAEVIRQSSDRFRGWANGRNPNAGPNQPNRQTQPATPDDPNGD